MVKQTALGWLLVVAGVLGVAHAQDAQPPTGERLQSCLVGDRVPDPPAAAEQGGYLFEYQSFRGETEDGRVCTVYRLRNTPDKPPTPFRWLLADEPVVTKARLGRCSGDADGCPWLTFVEYFAGRIDTSLSTLSYGLNADAFHEQAETFLSHTSVDGSDAADAGAVAASSVGKEVSGTFAAESGSLVDVHVLVKSRFEHAPGGGYTLVYEIDDLGSAGAFRHGVLRVAWTALEEIPQVAMLLARADAPEAGRTSLAELGSIVRHDDGFTVSIPAERFVLDDTFSFHVAVPGDPEPLVTLEMGAYVPVPGAE